MSWFSLRNADSSALAVVVGVDLGLFVFAKSKRFNWFGYAGVL
jgi:hypothetical protein